MKSLDFPGPLPRRCQSLRARGRPGKGAGHNSLPVHFWPGLSLVLFVLTFPYLAGLYPIVDFVKERIHIIVHPNHIEVAGYYVYENPYPFPIVQGFSIPLPSDREHPAPALVDVRQLSPEEKQVPVYHVLGLHRFEMGFSAKEKILVQVRYRQRAPAGDAWYILKTTRPWRRPLDRGTYTLLPRGVEITSSSYPLEPDGEGALGFQRERFMPESDWRFSWRAR